MSAAETELELLRSIVNSLARRTPIHSERDWRICTLCSGESRGCAAIRHTPDCVWMRAIALSRRYPLAGDLWKHHKGTVYLVIYLGTLESNGSQVVIYRAASDDSGTVWVRTLANWMERLPDGRYRFERMP